MRQLHEVPLTATAGDFAARRSNDALHPNTRLAAYAALLSAAYYIGTVLGYELLFPSSYLSVIWPPNTILLVALLCSPPRHWPWLLLVTFPVHVFAQVQFGSLLSTAALFHVYNCVLVLLTAACLRRFSLDDLSLGELRRAVLFIVVTTFAVAVSSLVWSPLIVSFSLGGDLATQWSLLVRSNVIPFLIATPCLVIGVNRGSDILRNMSLSRYAEFALLGLGLLAASLVMFGLNPQAMDHFPALFPLPFLLWAAMRFGPGGLSLLFLLFALMAVFSTTSGNGPFVTPSAEDSVLRLQIFLLALYIPLLLLASVVEERLSERVALRQSEARYRAVVEDQTELVCRFDSDGTHTFVNDAYCRHFGRSRAGLLGSRIWDLVPARDHEAMQDALTLLTPDRPVATRQQEVVTPSGELRWFQWRDRGLFDNRGRILEYQTVGHDLTEHKRLEEATNRLAHAARLAVAGELTASIAHELNQPLGAILNNVETAEHLLQSEPPSLDEMAAILADIRHDDVRASKVIRRLQDLLRKREMVVVPLDINDIVNEVMGLVTLDARRRGVGVVAELGADLSPILGDRVHIQQVLLNLLLNAMDAMSTTPQGQRRIVVRTGSDGEQSVTVSISDAGHGIPPDKMSTVFESFFTTKERGMGLGLAIARSIIDLHGGRIWASNNPLVGATFHFVLPGARAPVT